MRAIEDTAQDKTVLVLAAALVVWSLGCCFPSDQEAKDDVPTPSAVSDKQRQTAQADDDFVQTGETGYLYNDQIDQVAVAFSEDAMDKRMKAAVANDKQGYLELLDAGDMALVPANTAVRLIDNGMTTVKVRLLEGAYKNRAGWVTIEALHKAPK